MRRLDSFLRGLREDLGLLLGGLGFTGSGITILLAVLLAERGGLSFLSENLCSVTKLVNKTLLGFGGASGLEVGHRT